MRDVYYGEKYEPEDESEIEEVIDNSCINSATGIENKNYPFLNRYEKNNDVIFTERALLYGIPATLIYALFHCNSLSSWSWARCKHNLLNSSTINESYMVSLLNITESRFEEIFDKKIILN